MSVIDHTILTAFTETPIYADQLLRMYARRRRIMVVPSHALMVAARYAKPGGTGVLTELIGPLYQPVIRFVDLDAETALRIGTGIPSLKPSADADDVELRWLAVAPVIWAARHLEQRILTRSPWLYDGHDDLDIDRMP